MLSICACAYQKDRLTGRLAGGDWTRAFTEHQQVLKARHVARLLACPPIL